MKHKQAFAQRIVLLLSLVGLMECHAYKTDCLPKDPSCDSVLLSILHDPAYFSDYSQLYWSDASTGKVQRVSLLRAGDVEVIATGENTPEGVAQSSAGIVYWVAGGGTVVRTYDTKFQVVGSLITGGFSDADGIVLDEVNNKMYITDSGSSSVHSASIDGSNLSVVINSGISTTYGNPAVDSSTGLLYLADGSSIIRDNPANSPAEQVSIVTGLTGARNIVLDSSENKLYWTDQSTGKIQRANIDGTNVQDVLTGLNNPFGLAIDSQYNRVYWSETSTGQVWRANTDGSDKTLLISGLSLPRFVALGN